MEEEEIKEGGERETRGKRVVDHNEKFLFQALGWGVQIQSHRKVRYLSELLLRAELYAWSSMCHFAVCLDTVKCRVQTLGNTQKTTEFFWVTH